MTETITRILVPVDFSGSSDRALRYATTLAGRLGATVDLLHVVEDPFVTGAWSSEIYVPNLPELRDTLIADAGERLAAMKTGASLGVGVGTTVLRGEPAHTIVEQCHDWRVRSGRHGHTRTHRTVPYVHGQRRRTGRQKSSLPRDDGAGTCVNSRREFMTGDEGVV